MQLFFFFLMLLVIEMAGIASAEEPACTFSLSTGKRTDSLSWSVSGRHGVPNILAELDYKHLKTRTYNFACNIRKNNTLFHLFCSYGELRRGTMRDSDYMANNRRQEVSRSHAQVTGSYSADFMALLGRQFFSENPLSCTPLIGYSYSCMRIRAEHAVQRRIFDFLRSRPMVVKQKIAHLNSTYKACWDSPVLGIRIDYCHPAASQLHLYGQYLYYGHMRYHGIGFWNLRQNELKGSFHHRAKRSHGHGKQWQVGIAYSFINQITLSLDYTCATLTTKKGKDTSQSRTTHKKLEIPLRKVSAHSSEVRLALGYAF